jgi:hypothetical protein
MSCVVQVNFSVSEENMIQLHFFPPFHFSSLSALSLEATILIPLLFFLSFQVD